MENEKYYINTKDVPPNKMITRFIKMNITPQKAIDLGCGAGRDTIYLIKNGWNVLAIDKENTEKFIISQLNSEEKKRFKFEKQNFENIKLEPNNLLVANFCIPFCNAEFFEEFWNRITNSILKNGYFVGNFFGKNDAWNKKKEIIFLTKDEVQDLFKDSFEIIEFHEIEKDLTTGMGNIKHWHLYSIIAKKKIIEL